MKSNQDVAEFFKLFSNKNRLEIILALAAENLTVSQIVAATGLSQSLVSQQLKMLKAARIVTSRRLGKTSLYSLFDRHILQILEDVQEHLNEHLNEHLTVSQEVSDEKA